MCPRYCFHTRGLWNTRRQGWNRGGIGDDRDRRFFAPRDVWDWGRRSGLGQCENGWRVRRHRVRYERLGWITFGGWPRNLRLGHGGRINCRRWFAWHVWLRVRLETRRYDRQFH